MVGTFNPFTFKVIIDKYDPIAIYFIVLGSSLYTLSVFPVTNPLSVASFANTFSHSMCCPFILFIIYFAVLKLLSLIRSHFFVCLFLCPLLWEISQKRHYYDLCQSILSMFSSKSFIVSGHILRSLIYFDFMFVYGVKEPSNLIFLYRAVQFAQHHLLKTVFPQFHSFASFVRLIALVGHLYIFFGITHIQILCPFFN